ncbi:MAG TPA: diadenylate cyclase CdaA [Gemmatimonadales bacterium]|jgi:diadenylate cyclase|nr:diadenylate cyclase CdaA [Gemmatimonadales bacterium]
MLPDQLRLFVPTWRDVVEVVLVAFLLYRLLRFLAGTRALQIVFGLLVLLAAWLAAAWLKFTMVTYLLSGIFTYGVFALLVVFQPEVRQALARLGRARPFRFGTGSASAAVAEQVAEALARLSRASTGAIIAVERDDTLEPVAASGTPIDGVVSAELLHGIFLPPSPLHDGAVIVRGERLAAAGAILPLTQEPVSDRSLGTRHRAALGLSEETDALVFAVSEETGQVSLAVRGRLYRDLTPEQVRRALLAPRLEPAQITVPTT